MNNSEQNYLSGLNEQQRDAVLCRSNIVFVEAGPGTGKTHLLTSKLVDFIESSSSPQKVVALSYTNTAAHQIGDRFKKKAEESGITKEFTFFNGTIHSFCFRMMKEYSKSLSKVFDYVILDDEELQELGQEICQQLGGKVELKRIMDSLNSNLKDLPDELDEQISKIKEGYKVISIQDILAFFIKAMDEDTMFRRWMKEQVTVMAIDEAQDLSSLNYTILDRLIEINPQLKVFLVGDPRQNIFEFNGGSYANLHDFLERHEQHEVKHLTITYRCGQSIADYVNTFRFTDCDNLGLTSMCKEAGSISVKMAMSEMSEAQQVIHALKDIGDISSCAVLCNNLKYLEPFILELQAERIPYKVFGGRKTLKKHVRFLNHVLRIIDSDNAYSIRKVAQYAGIDLMENGRKRKSKFFESELGRIISGIREETKGARFRDILNRVLMLVMRDSSDNEELQRDYDILEELSCQYESIGDYMVAFATDTDHFAQFYRKDYVECSIPTEKGYLTISTIHSAKGLEWSNVFIMGLCEGNFPNPYFCQNKSPEEQEEFFNAEWKKMYVASTRARENLCLTYSTTITRKGYSFRKGPSRFIRNNQYQRS